MSVVRILTCRRAALLIYGVHAVGSEKDISLLLIDIVDFADIPRPGSKQDCLSGSAVDPEEMPPVVPLRDPEDVTAAHIMTVESVVVHKCLCLLLRQHPYRGILGRNGHQLIELMPPPIVLKGKILRIRVPLSEKEVVLVCKWLPVHLGHRPGGHVEKHRHGLGEPVPGLRIVDPSQLRLYPVLGRGLPQGYLSFPDIFPSH